MPTRTAIAALLLAAGSAAAQDCTFAVPDVPDFDQRRLLPATSGGLPGDGGMYCVPTSNVNWLAYFANRGAPQPATLAGPRDWQSQNEYLRTSDTQRLMGTLMETDPSDGTDGFKGINGLKFYLATFAFGDFTATRFGAWSGGSPFITPAFIKAMHDGGGYVSAVFGFYSSSTGGFRDGGHCITVNGIWDLTCGQAPILQFRDPNHTVDDPGGYSQSKFHTNLAAMTPVQGNFRREAGASSVSMTLYRLDTTTASKNFLDSYYCIFPAAGLIADPGFAGQLRLTRPFRPTGNPAPANQVFNTPTQAGTIKGIAFAADQMSYYYSADGATGAPSGVWKINPLTGVSSRIVTLTGTVSIPAGPIAVSRLGDLYMIVGNSVYRYDLATPNTLPIGSLDNISPLPQGLAYDDKTDTVIVITAAPVGGNRKVYRFGRTLPAFGAVYDLLVNPSGTACIAPDANTNDAYFVCASQSGTLYRVQRQGTDLVQTHSIFHLNAGLTGLNVTDANSLVYAVNGVLTEKEQNTQGNWVNRAGSRWAGTAAAGPIALARSRTNHEATETGPSFNNLLNPTVYPFIPPCYANCDNSSVAPVLNVNDFICFQTKFAQRDPYANCDNSTTPPILNVNDFVCFQQKYAAGCT